MIEDTSGFYCYDDTFKTLNYAPDCVYFPDGSVIVESLHDTYTYPVFGYYWFATQTEAELFFGVPIDA